MRKRKRKTFRILVLFALAFLFFESAGVNFHAYANDNIVIDGVFSDWDSVVKTRIGDDRLNYVAFVLDGDYMYFYVDACENWTAYMAGAHNNGKYTVTTDLGKQMIFQLQAQDGNPVVRGVAGASVAYSDLTYGKNSYLYEISVPVSQLPPYIETVSFGFYLQDPVILDVHDRQFSGVNAVQDTICCDGAFDDWTYYPHPAIYYGSSAEGGTFVEGQAAMYTDGISVYAHVYSAMKQHVANNGKDLVSGLTVTLNSTVAREASKTFLPQLVTLKDDGTIEYNPDFSNLDMGVHEFYVIDMQGWKNEGVGFDFWSDPDTYAYGGNALYGKAYISIQPSKCEMEMELDIATLAGKFKMQADQIKLFTASFAAIGAQRVSCAGVSSGPWVGIAVSVLSVALVLFVKRRKVLP